MAGKIQRGLTRYNFIIIGKEENKMVYQWKIPKYSINAQAAGEELERISIEKSLTPENVVEESRSENAMLHACFDWNDETAAESYRRTQAREIIQNIVTIKIENKELNEPIRAFISTKDDYKPLNIVVRTQNYSDEMLSNALRELNSFKRKYSSLEQLAELFDSIQMFLDKMTVCEEIKTNE